MTDLWLRSTKDIEKNVETARPGGGDGGLVNEVYPDDGGTRSTSQVEGNNANNSQKVILGNQAQTNNNSGGDGLVNEIRRIIRMLLSRERISGQFRRRQQTDRSRKLLKVKKKYPAILNCSKV